MSTDDWEEIRKSIPETLPAPWNAALDLAFRELPRADPLYRPTSFWRPGVRALMGDLSERGIESFKSWPSSAYFFYPRYQRTFSYKMLDDVLPTLRQVAPTTPDRWFRDRLIGSTDAMRDLDVALALHDPTHLALDFERFGESTVGRPPQQYHAFGPTGPSLGKPYLNYAVILAALSKYIDRSPQTVVEIGAGCGVLGEILLQNDPKVQYVDLDIPPLSVIAHYYLTHALTGTEFLNDIDVGDRKLALAPGGSSACLSSWRMPQLTGRADVFLNAFSFQEMEPEVVREYAQQINRLESRFVVSLNSRAGKPLSANSEIGVKEQVTSDMIHDTFTGLGYETMARLGRPVSPPQAELLIMRRR